MKDGGGLDPATPETDTLLTLNIFLSYRRDDASAYALLLFQSLSDRYGHSVFMDIETLAPGLDFVDAINDTLGRCDILLALVGRGWLTASDAEGNARLENPEDFVRLEIEAALARNIRVVPVLVGGALMPRGNQLPGDLAKLARRHAFELSDTRWRTDVAALIKAIEHVPEAAPAKPLEPESPVNKSASESTEDIEVVAASVTEEPVADAPAATTQVEQTEPALVEEPAVPPAAATLAEEGSQSPQEMLDESALASGSDAGVDLFGVSAEEPSPDDLERAEPPLEEIDGTKEQRVEPAPASPKRREPSQSEPRIKDLPLRNAILPLSTVDVPSAMSEPIDHERTEPSLEQGTAEVDSSASRDEVIAENPVATDSTVVPLSKSRIAEPPIKPKTGAAPEITQQKAVIRDVPSDAVQVRSRRTWRKYCIAGAATLILISVIVAVLAFSTASSPSSPMAWSQPSSIDKGNPMFGVSCASDSFCGAIDQGMNAVMFDGSKWSQPIPLGLHDSPGVGGSGGPEISCPSSSFCMAVLNRDYLTFNGSKWSQPQAALPLNSPGTLVISCTSASFCMAVDDVSNDYLTFNGSTWSQPLSVGVGNANISAISCPSTSFCGAVSYYGDAQTFNGSTWSKPVLIIPKPNSNDIGLIGVSCTSASFCVAADGDNANTVTFNGSTWSKPVAIDGNNHPSLNAISCASTSFCVAATRGNAVFFDGKAWSQPFSVEHNQLNRISCPSSSFCAAVDDDGNAVVGHAAT